MSDEYLDIVNKQDVTIGKETRKRVHEIGLWHRGVHVFLFDKDGKMLIQKRNASRASNPLRLDCSVSEHVLAGESYTEAAVRGLREELGIENIELKQLTKFRMNYGINDNEISVIYKGKIDSQQIDFDKNEIEEVFYMSIDDIKEKTQNEKNLFCDWFVQMMNWYFERETRMVVMN
ncbi:MAG: NUDIX domain-containing protein [Anaerolineales bacterium]|nr:NUDIX domain-containing protein [Anaerolineales bacterium]